jgi:3-oxoacyl-[acyl-carrier protein] reductase
VNAIAPGFVHTDATRAGDTESAWKERAAKVGALAMMGRVGEADDVANAVAFLASPDSGWITAQVIAVDGGRMDYIAG